MMASLEKLVLDLCDRDLRENAILVLANRREICQDLAPLLWHSFGTMSVFLQEIVSIYPCLTHPNLSIHQSTRVCHVIKLLQGVSSHPDTMILFVNANMPIYLYPFLNTTSKTKPFEYLRIASLGLIGTLVKAVDANVIFYLLQSEIMPLCLRTMENGGELSKTVATFIVQKILQADFGLQYICARAERFSAVIQVFSTMVGPLSEQPSMRLLKFIILCCLRLSDNPRARYTLRHVIPNLFPERTVEKCIRETETYRLLLEKVYGEPNFQGVFGQMR